MTDTPIPAAVELSDAALTRLERSVLGDCFGQGLYARAPVMRADLASLIAAYKALSSPITAGASREEIARAVCRAKGQDPDSPVREGSQPLKPTWQYSPNLRIADAVLSLTAAAGRDQECRAVPVHEHPPEQGLAERWFLCAATVTKPGHGFVTHSHTASLRKGKSENEARGSFIAWTLEIKPGFSIADVTVSEVTDLVASAKPTTSEESGMGRRGNQNDAPTPGAA